jgi:hypothetical protein
LAELTVALWTLGANADPAAPPALGVALNSGASCGAQNWYDSVKPHVDAFFVAAEQIDPRNTPAASARALFDTMNAERANIAAVAVPTCATQAQTVLFAVLDSDRQSIEEQFAGGSNPAAAEYIRQNIVFMAWLRWLGVS